MSDSHSEQNGTISDANSSIFAPLPKQTLIGLLFYTSPVLGACFSTLLSNFPDVPDPRVHVYKPHLGVRWNLQQQAVVGDTRLVGGDVGQ